MKTTTQDTLRLSQHLSQHHSWPAASTFGGRETNKMIIKVFSLVWRHQKPKLCHVVTINPVLMSLFIFLHFILKYFNLLLACLVHYYSFNAASRAVLNLFIF